MKDCTCIHTAKHHHQSGHCRKGCDCRAAQLKWSRKARREVARRKALSKVVG